MLERMREPGVEEWQQKAYSVLHAMPQHGMTLDRSDAFIYDILREKMESSLGSRPKMKGC